VLEELLLVMLDDLFLFPSNCLQRCCCKKDFERGDMGDGGATPLSTVDLGIVVVIIHCGNHEQNIYSPDDQGSLEIPKTKYMTVFWRYL